MMSLGRLTFFLTVAFAFAAGGCQSTAQPKGDGPAVIQSAAQAASSMKLVQTVPVKTSANASGVVEKKYIVELTLENRNNAPMWLLTRRLGERPLTVSARFFPGNIRQPIVIEPFYGRTPANQFVEVAVLKFISFKKGEAGFYAVRLPAGGRITFPRWEISGYGDNPPAFEVWEVNELIVNNDLPLENWLKRPLMAAHDAILTARSESDVVNDPAFQAFIRQRKSVFYANPPSPPKEPLEFLTAKGLLREETRPIEGIPMPAKMDK